MTNQEIADEVRRLFQLDVDAVLAYDRAIAAVSEGMVANALAEFRLDHQRHVLELSKAMLDLGANPPEAKPDLKGTILGGFTAVRARFGTEQMLQAMRSNEQLTNGSYATALAKPLPEDVLAIVRKGYADEQRHLAWIEKTLDARSWEETGASP